MRVFTAFVRYSRARFLVSPLEERTVGCMKRPRSDTHGGCEDEVPDNVRAIRTSKRSTWRLRQRPRPRGWGLSGAWPTGTGVADDLLDKLGKV